MLARKIARWSDDHFDKLSKIDPDTPQGLHDRAADNWRPLLGIADLISPACGQTARTAAITLMNHDDDHESAQVLLLSDIQNIFETQKGRTRISTEELLNILWNIDDHPWGEWNRGKPITPGQIAKKLKPFGIRPKKFRQGAGTLRGYDLEQFYDAFTRYLPGTPEQTNENNHLEQNLPGT